MIDLHCHILPGIDDGAFDLAESVAMCRLAAADGCEVMVATPHQHHPTWWNGDCARLAALVAMVQEAVGERPLVLPGAEIRVDDQILSDIDRLPGGCLQPLAGTRSLLLELDRRGPTVDAVELVHEVSVAGWRPILAHPEMFPWLMARMDLLERLVERGAFLQITAMSLTGRFGRRAEGACRELLDRGLVHFVASDAHGIDHRPPGLSEAFRVLRAGWGESIARALTHGNPLAVLEDRPIEAPAVA